MKQTSYGSWNSPISAEKVAEGGSRLFHLETTPKEIYWVESRPLEKGRSALMRASDHKTLIPEPFSIRSTVHEYGGKSFTFHQETLYFVNFTDQYLYKSSPGEAPLLLLEAPNKRFADFVVHQNGLWLYSVMEDHTDPAHVRNSLVKIELSTKKIVPLAEGHDFYGFPRISHDGKKLAYIFWDHPNMPWDGTELWVAKLNAKGTILSEKRVAGSVEESVMEPLWSSQDKLFYISDRSGYWNIYAEDGTALTNRKADFSYPLWTLGQKHYDFLQKEGKEYIAAIYTEKAIDYVVLIDLEKQKLQEIPLPFVRYDQLYTQKGQVLLLATSSTEATEIISLDPFNKKMKTLYKPHQNSIDPRYFSHSETIEFPTAKRKTAFLFYYPPTNPDYTLPLKEKPPLIVFVHGGPTAHTTPSFQWGIQFWTSRGFAVADVNYGGSSGYGREYRNRLRKKWGVVDIEDCTHAALYLIQKGLADKNRIAIRGGSAGGYTTLAALTFRHTFSVGTSYYGVSDLELLAKDTGKFESKYLEGLIGPYPKEKKRYHELSPLYHIDILKHPVLLLQGDEDKVVPKEQSELFYKALKKKKIPTEYILFKGEQHGFRKAETIKKSLEAEYAFYAKIFKIS